MLNNKNSLGLQVEGGFVQGMGWTCIEELVWGDEQHKWVKPGTLFTRGPGEHKILYTEFILQPWQSIIPVTGSTFVSGM